MNTRIRTAHEIRRAFLGFFAARGHVEVPSAPLVPKGDPTLLFTSAGMVPFKEYYLRPENLPYARATSVQKCLRAGDLESVGKTLRHHTFFEMLGNFSFGDYFKREAIEWAWEFVTRELDLPVDRLSVSVYEEDDEAYDLWRELAGLPPERVIRLGKKDNFWGPVGKTGICGPCSEIYFDTGAGRGCGRDSCATGCDCDRYLEFWNLVFPQFFRDEAGVYQPLAKPGIDTGLGLERLAVIMQGVEDNYHTDLFAPIVDSLLDLLPPGIRIGRDERMAVNMVADHARALTVAVSEGIYPSNEGRGYLLRRLLRRALTRFHSFGVTEPFLHRLVETVVGVLGGDYPDLAVRPRETAMVIRSEEESFFRTLEDGASRFAAIVAETKAAGGSAIPGDRVFLLHDTYGFPLELTKALAEDEGLGVDEEGFERSMEEQRQRAQERSSFVGEGPDRAVMTTVTEGESSLFTGYETLGGESVIRSYRFVDAPRMADAAGGGAAAPGLELVFDRTPFYATAGGQIADRGWIEIAGRRLEVKDVSKRGGETVHLVETPWAPDEWRALAAAGARARLQVDDAKRLRIARNHTATHLLHAALRSIVGRHVAQAGSLVEEQRLRFDFNHFQGVPSGALREIEILVNRWIRDAIELRFEWMEYQEAIEAGVIALFDEKYGRRVRVVRIGEISAELCGGTHVSNTGQIGLFLVAAESGVAAGVRRIEALTGEGALAAVQAAIRRGEEVGELLRVGSLEVPGRVRALLDEMDGLRRELKRAERGDAAQELDRLIAGGRRVDGVLVAAGRMAVKDLGALRGQADLFRAKAASGVAVLSAELGGKMQFVVTVTDDLIERGLAADALVRELARVAGGSGGGKKHLAQLGAKDAGGERAVFDALPEIVRALRSR